MQPKSQPNQSIRGFIKEGFTEGLLHWIELGLSVLKLVSQCMYTLHALSWLEGIPRIFQAYWIYTVYILRNAFISSNHPLPHCWTVNEPKLLAMEQNLKKRVFSLQQVPFRVFLIIIVSQLSTSLAIYSVVSPLYPFSCSYCKIPLRPNITSI